MSRIFLSHSNKDEFEVIAIRAWLKENGWDDILLNVHPDRRNSNRRALGARAV